MKSATVQVLERVIRGAYKETHTAGVFTDGHNSFLPLAYKIIPTCHTARKTQDCSPTISPFNNLLHLIIHLPRKGCRLCALSQSCLFPPAGWQGAQARVGAGESRGGLGPKHQVHRDHAHVDAADDVRCPLHLGHQQRLLQSQRGARLVQPRRV